MRTWPALALMTLLLIPAGSAAFADDIDFDEAYYARIAVGDIPTTSDVEPDGQVNVVEYVRFQHPMDDASGTSVVQLGDGEARCTCSAFSREGQTIRVGQEVEAGTYIAGLVWSMPVQTSYTVLPRAYDADMDGTAQVNVYARAGNQAFGPVGAQELACTQGPCTIYFFAGSGQAPLGGAPWFAVHPATTTPSAPVLGDDSFGWLEIAVGIVAGIALWAFLVQRGVVQARSRKQVVQKAAHTEVAEREPRQVLEARKRVLMAGLKELEVAKMQKEIPDDVYDALKAELKKETVTTMRALENAKA